MSYTENIVVCSRASSADYVIDHASASTVTSTI